MDLGFLYVDKNLRNTKNNIFCKNHSTCNCSKPHNFGPSLINVDFLEAEYFVISKKYKRAKIVNSWLAEMGCFEKFSPKEGHSKMTKRIGHPVHDSPY